jgi:hypothetical protein
MSDFHLPREIAQQLPPRYADVMDDRGSRKDTK